MGRLESPDYYRCHNAIGNFFHMIWDCPKICQFWSDVTSFMETKLALPNTCNPARCLLGDLEEEELGAARKGFGPISLFYAKKAIALRWKNQSPPLYRKWVDLVNQAMPMYKLTYTARACTKKN